MDPPEKIAPILPQYIIDTANQIVYGKKGEMSKFVRSAIPPPGESVADWAAYQLQMVVSIITPIVGMLHYDCKCENMCLGNYLEYLWVDRSIEINGEHRIVRSGETPCDEPTSIPAIEYCDRILQWAKNVLNNDEICPVSPSGMFPVGFFAYVKDIFKCLLRIFYHIYYNHFNFFKIMDTDMIPIIHRMCYFVAKVASFCVKVEDDMLAPINQLYTIWEQIYADESDEHESGRLDERITDDDSIDSY